jgi:thioredoxin 1
MNMGRPNRFLRITSWFRECFGAWIFAGVLLTFAGTVFAQTVSSEASTGFPPLDQWRNAVLSGDASLLKALYSTEPPAQVLANNVSTDAAADIAFWLGLKAQGLTLEIVRVKTKPDAESIIFKAEVLQQGSPQAQTLKVVDAQAWKNTAGQWRLVSAERTDAPHLKQPSDMKKDIYPADADAHAEIKEAEQKAATEHKRILLVFGADWCYDCHVLDLAFQRPDLAPIVSSGYELVHVDLGPDGKKNADVAKEFDAPLDKGVPVLAVIESNGTVVESQKNGEFEDTRSLTPEALLAFLNKWKPAAQ